MKKKGIFLCNLIILSLLLPAIGKGKTTVDRKVGFELLDSILIGFQHLANSGQGGYTPVNKILQKSMAKLKKAKSNNAIDDVFYFRYKRVLVILKLVTLNLKDDQEGILLDWISREVNQFVTSILGEGSTSENKEGRGIGVVAAAVTYELLNLHIYLDTLNNREELVKKYMNILSPKDREK